MNTISLFSIPVHKTNILVSDEIKEIVKHYDYERMPNDSGWYTKNKYILNDVKFLSLRNSITEQFNKFVYDILEVQPNLEFKLTTSWAVKIESGDWGQRHSHPNSLISGVIYIDTDSNTGSISFHKENNYRNLFPDLLSIEFKQWNEYNAKAWTFSPSIGDILFFPSFLEHSMEKNNSTKTRYSLAFNFFPVGKIGHNECELELN